MAEKRIYRFWNEKDAFYPELLAGLRRAHNMGYSVVELARLLSHSYCDKLYDVMRAADIIPVMGQGRRPKLPVPAALLTALGKSRLGFHQWCNSHDLDPGPVADALTRQEDTTNDISYSAHHAFKKDFPTLYAKIYQTPPPNTPFRDPEPIAERSSTYSVYIVFDRERLAYVAYIPEMPECRAEAKTRDEAYDRLKGRYVLRASVIKLQLLLPRS